MNESVYDQILTEFLSAVGPWSDVIVIGGGFAPIIYRIYLAGQDAFAIR